MLIFNQLLLALQLLYFLSVSSHPHLLSKSLAKREEVPEVLGGVHSHWLKKRGEQIVEDVKTAAAEESTLGAEGGILKGLETTEDDERLARTKGDPNLGRENKDGIEDDQLSHDHSGEKSRFKKVCSACGDFFTRVNDFCHRVIRRVFRRNKAAEDTKPESAAAPLLEEKKESPPAGRTWGN
ncbi:hypothetical protein PCANC_19226 [Puccinia coronata f. sp. avenae]|uniref:Secreted protein n=1 Tax=Puccinia coronata f. sp. avenae TaxID=200324 RepID=A0A2N5SK20_9BASI|nr:hypothetical protein PCANC_19226 [Puccinia coronata f. sp. avenae]